MESILSDALEALELHGDEFEAEMGAEAVQKLLLSISLESLRSSIVSYFHFVTSGVYVCKNDPKYLELTLLVQTEYPNEDSANDPCFQWI
ncbi:MAG: hypothetical protein RLZZ184_2769 [Cyanobacteriota bacterium]